MYRPRLQTIHFLDSDMTIGHIYCRLLKYDKAMECYERAVRENPDNLSAEIRRIRLALLATQNTQKSDTVQGNLDNLLGKLVKDFSQLDTIDNKRPLEFTPLINRVDMEEHQQLIEGLLFAYKLYRAVKYPKVALKIIDLYKIPSSNECLPKDVHALLMLVSTYFIASDLFINVIFQEHEIDSVVSNWTSFIEKEGVSTRGIVLLNSLGELLFDQGKLDKAYRCFQRSLNMQYLLYGNRPNAKMMTSLRFLGMIATKLEIIAPLKKLHSMLRMV